MSGAGLRDLVGVDARFQRREVFFRGQFGGAARGAVAAMAAWLVPNFAEVTDERISLAAVVLD
jgi:hypothetical protein